MAILCFWPPDNFIPLYPTIDNKPSGKDEILLTNYDALDFFKISLITSSLGCYLQEYIMLSNKVPENSTGYWETNPIWFLKLIKSYYFIEIPSIKTLPYEIS